MPNAVSIFNNIVPRFATEETLHLNGKIIRKQITLASRVILHKSTRYLKLAHFYTHSYQTHHPSSGIFHTTVKISPPKKSVVVHTRIDEMFPPLVIKLLTQCAATNPFCSVENTTIILQRLSNEQHFRRTSLSRLQNY